ncbi:hypothetical protein FF38_09913 [Lucilia cuprina]|uniref:Uncharacterized protein n=1 Tax=Lucilia cuprina TaxID=7375 RepID=A0A0L0BZP7_LUCCU|nr:hypothetical protein FF38_09913 [Lucilia cuprina]
MSKQACDKWIDNEPPERTPSTTCLTVSFDLIDSTKLFHLESSSPSIGSLERQQCCSAVFLNNFNMYFGFCGCVFIFTSCVKMLLIGFDMRLFVLHFYVVFQFSLTCNPLQWLRHHSLRYRGLYLVFRSSKILVYFILPAIVILILNELHSNYVPLSFLRAFPKLQKFCYI